MIYKNMWPHKHYEALKIFNFFFVSVIRSVLCYCCWLNCFFLLLLFRSFVTVYRWYFGYAILLYLSIKWRARVWSWKTIYIPYSLTAKAISIFTVYLHRKSYLINRKCKETDRSTWNIVMMNAVEQVSFYFSSPHPNVHPNDKTTHE